MAISCLAALPRGGRPTRRIARSWTADASGISEKLILLECPPVGRTFLAARPARADDADRLDIASPPAGIGHHEQTARRGPTESQVSRLLLRVSNVRTIERFGVAEHACGFALAFRVSHSNTIQYIRKSAGRYSPCADLRVDLLQPELHVDLAVYRARSREVLEPALLADAPIPAARLAGSWPLGHNGRADRYDASCESAGG